MKKKISFNPIIDKNKDIELKEIIIKLWEEKVLITSITLICVILGYVYGTSKLQVFKSEVTLRYAPFTLFENYQSLMPDRLNSGTNDNVYSFDLDFNNEFKLNFLSLDTLNSFFQQNSEIDEFKNYLREKKISFAKYVQGKLGTSSEEKKIVTKHYNLNNQEKYYLIFNKPLNGDKFLNDYTFFVKKKTEEIFIKQLNYIINNKINILKQNLKIANAINLENPILSSSDEGILVVNEPETLFYKGSKVLSEELNYLYEMNDEVANLSLDYNPIVQKASFPVLVTKSPKIYSSVGLVLGLFLSFIIIFLRSIINHKK